MPRVGSDQMVELDGQSSGSLPLTMAREAIPPLCTHVLHSFSPHGLKGMVYEGGAEAGGAGGKWGHLHWLLRPPDERFGSSSSCLLCCSAPATVHRHTRGLRWGAGPSVSQASGSRPGSLQCDPLAESVVVTKLPVHSVSAL